MQILRFGVSAKKFGHNQEYGGHNNLAKLWKKNKFFWALEGSFSVRIATVASNCQISSLLIPSWFQDAPQSTCSRKTLLRHPVGRSINSILPQIKFLGLLLVILCGKYAKWAYFTSFWMILSRIWAVNRFIAHPDASASQIKGYLIHRLVYYQFKRCYSLLNHLNRWI